MVEVNQGMFAWSFRQNYGTICALPLFNMLTMDSESNISLCHNLPFTQAITY